MSNRRRLMKQARRHDVPDCGRLCDGRLVLCGGVGRTGGGTMGLKNPNLTSDLSDPIELRSADTVRGQAHWVDPSFQNKCGACEHFPLNRHGNPVGSRVCGDPAAGQSRWWSIYETLANVVTGFLMGVTINVLVLPLFGYPVSFVHALDITAIFTVATTVRSYTLRRIFNMINRSKA